MTCNMVCMLINNNLNKDYLLLYIYIYLYFYTLGLSWHHKYCCKRYMNFAFCTCKYMLSETLDYWRKAKHHVAIFTCRIECISSNMVRNVTILGQNKYICFSIASKKIKRYDSYVFFNLVLDLYSSRG